MNNEHNNNEIPSPEDFWPEAKDLLDGHFAKSKRVLLFFGMSLICFISIIGFVFMNQNNVGKIASFDKNKSQKELKASELLNKNVPVNVKVKTNPVAVLVNKINDTSTNLKTSTNQSKDHNKIIIIKSDQLISARSSSIENNYTSSVNKDEITRSNMQSTAALTIENTAIDEARTDLIAFTSMPLLPYKLFEQKTNLILNEQKNTSVTIYEDYFKKNNKLEYFIDMYAGYQSVSKKIKSEPLLTEYADIRNTSEKKINTLYFGLNFTVEKNKFLVQTGLEYNTIGEQNNYEAKSKQWLQNDENVWDVYNKQIIKTDTVYHFGIVNYNQTIVNVKDSTLLTKSDSIFIYYADSSIVKANGKTTISYLEIPIMIGYQINIGKVSIAPFAGVSIGYLTKTNGMYINKSITGIEEINDRNLMTTFNFNYHLKLQLAYNLNDKLMLVLTPQVSNNLFSVSQKLSGINTKYSALGTSFGLSYKL